MTDDYICEDCGKKIKDCVFWQNIDSILEDVHSGKIKMETVTGEEFIKELKELEDEDETT